MNTRKRRRSGFTLIELLVVVSIISLLLSILIPSLQRARKQARTVICGTHLRSLGQGWEMYADDHGDTLLPARLPVFSAGGFASQSNYYRISTGMKYRPRWPALMQQYVGVPAIEKPSTIRSRQNYHNEVYVCPTVQHWKDERNAAYGYNYQFLGSHRSKGGGARNLPVGGTEVFKTAETVVAGDSNGSAAAFPASMRQEHRNSSRRTRRRGNYGWLLDPPRMTPGSSRAGGRGSPRSAPDERHRGHANMVFADGHVSLLTLAQLGYQVGGDGRVLMTGPDANNRFFSGTGEDSSPP